MADIGKDIERPLGQKLQPKRRASRGISGGTLAAVLAVLAVIGVSGAIALRDKPFRKPQDVAVSTPKVVAAATGAGAAGGAGVVGA
ncbi:MAG: divergent polysaccharide deacetylase family protein, partial [Mesorhizobium sp.]